MCRGRAFGTLAVLALAVGAIATGCSSGTSTSSGTTSTTSRTTSTTSALAACQPANTQFDRWLSSQKAAVTADGNTTAAWLKYESDTNNVIPDPSSAQFTAATNEFNTNNQTAQAARQTASQDLAAYQAALKGCNQSSLPTECQGDFGQHQPLIDTATRQNGANDTAVQAIVARLQAVRSGNLSAVNAQTGPYNAAIDALNAATDAFSNASNGHTTAASNCSSTFATQPAPAPTPAAPSGVTKANYNAITNGMTLAQVEHILGPNQTGGSPGGSNETLYQWYAGAPGSDTYISVWFGSDVRVTSKDQTGLK